MNPRLENNLPSVKSEGKSVKETIDRAGSIDVKPAAGRDHASAVRKWNISARITRRLPLQSK